MYVEKGRSPSAPALCNGHGVSYWSTERDGGRPCKFSCTALHAVLPTHTHVDKSKKGLHVTSAVERWPKNVPRLLFFLLCLRRQQTGNENRQLSHTQRLVRSSSSSLSTGNWIHNQSKRRINSIAQRWYTNITVLRHEWCLVNNNNNLVWLLGQLS